MIQASILNSYPRIGDTHAEQALRRAIARSDRGEASPDEIHAAEDEMTRQAIADQAKAGLDIVTDGQIRWHDPVSHVARGLAGFKIGGLLRYFDTNTYYRQPETIGPIGRERPFLVEAYRFAVGVAAPLPVKAIVTGPLTIARLSRDPQNRGLRTLTLQIASALNRELLDLEAAGATLIQIDEPAISRYPENLDILRDAMRRLISGLTCARTILATSFGDATLLLRDLSRMPISMLGLDLLAAGGRAAEVVHALPEDLGLLLGAVDGRNTRLEDPGEVFERLLRPVCDRLRLAARDIDIHITTNHGLEFLPRDVARAKLSILAAVRDRARAEAPPADRCEAPAIEAERRPGAVPPAIGRDGDERGQEEGR